MRDRERVQVFGKAQRGEDGGRVRRLAHQQREEEEEEEGKWEGIHGTSKLFVFMAINGVSPIPCGCPPIQSLTMGHVHIYIYISSRIVQPVPGIKYIDTFVDISSEGRRRII
eukprot:gene8048-5601_t